MALFSRRKKTDDVEAEDGFAESPMPAAAEPESADAAPVASAAAPTAPDAAPIAPDGPTESAASVGISVSSYRGLGGQAAPAAPAARMAPARAPEAPVAATTVPGIRDNVVLREALAALPVSPESPDLLEIARQLMQGHLFLRVKGDARELLAEGKDLPLGVAVVGDKQFVLAYSSGAALRASIAADRDTGTSAMGQPVLAVIRHVLGGPYAGLIIDNSSAPARAVLPRELLEKLLEQADETLEVKTLLAGDRTDATAGAVVEALTRVKFWVAVNRSEEGRFGVAEARSQDGARLIELYSHPLEVASLRRGDQAAPMTAAQLAGALRADEALDGVIVDPGGPWIRLSRSDLAPLIALAG
ncbi:SseB protein N-terminal domain-containing protein [Microbacterium sp. cf046]|uniref:SseB family protein n=1 Tax=Microbacterium sp. cf046 TaxID=1761803 RepID=UPI0008EFF359|nr:SseB family protein [Microbacterium sp. cf046]SFR94988.1 SseB protein N-terminal domain-containing protein [Microbacterium sp. cf046]